MMPPGSFDEVPDVVSPTASTPTSAINSNARCARSRSTRARSSDCSTPEGHGRRVRALCGRKAGAARRRARAPQSATGSRRRPDRGQRPGHDHRSSEDRALPVPVRTSSASGIPVRRPPARPAPWPRTAVGRGDQSISSVLWVHGFDAAVRKRLRPEPVVPADHGLVWGVLAAIEPAFGRSPTAHRHRALRQTGEPRGPGDRAAIVGWFRYCRGRAGPVAAVPSGLQWT